ncbi:MAG: hypothetical protein IPL46_16935 [Saprospiraceae bacterium]|nr:hypothetical protein [Saprospiraceae bacterium]
MLTTKDQMMKEQSQSLVLVLLAFILSISSYSQEKLETEGAIIIRNSEAAAPVSGTIRFNTTSNDFEGWNGLFWVSFTGLQLILGK